MAGGSVVRAVSLTDNKRTRTLKRLERAARCGGDVIDNDRCMRSCQRSEIIQISRRTLQGVITVNQYHVAWRPVAGLATSAAHQTATRELPGCEMKRSPNAVPNRRTTGLL